MSGAVLERLGVGSRNMPERESASSTSVSISSRASADGGAARGGAAVGGGGEGGVWLVGWAFESHDPNLFYAV